MGSGNHAFTIIFIHEGAWKHAETTVYVLGQFKLVYGPFGQMNMHLILNFCPEQPGRLKHTNLPRTLTSQFFTHTSLPEPLTTTSLPHPLAQNMPLLAV